MARYYGPRRIKRTPPSAAEQRLGKLVLWVIGAFGIGYFLLMVGGILYEIATKFLPKTCDAVVELSTDAVTAVSEHNWQYTDAVLYMGLVFILVGRYTKLMDKLFE